MASCSKLQKVFICHSHLDAKLARAFEDAFKDIFEDVQVANCSSRAPGAGAPPGTNWLDWTKGQIRKSQEVVILWTPEAAATPWPMWEAGFFHGDQPGNLPDDRHATLIRFCKDLPETFVPLQSFDGTQENELARFFTDVARRHTERPASTRSIKGSVGRAVSKSLVAIRSWLSDRPWGSETLIHHRDVIRIRQQIELAKRTLHAAAATGRVLPDDLPAIVLARNLRLECLLLDPRSEAARLWSSSYRRDRADEIIRSVFLLYMLPNTEVRLSKTYIANSMLATDLDDPQSRMVINFHVFGGRAEDRPFLQLDPKSAWYTTFAQQFRDLWEGATPFKLHLAASGMKDLGNGLHWFPFSRPADRYGVLLQYAYLSDQFRTLSLHRDVIRRADVPDDLRRQLWPVLRLEDVEADADVQALVRKRRVEELEGRRSPYPLVNLERLHFTFPSPLDSKSPMEILRFPELLAILGEHDYRAPTPFFIADAAALPSSLDGVDFREPKRLSELPKTWSMSTCRGCDRDDFDVRFYIGPQRIVTCKTCGLEMANPQPDVLAQRESFRKYATSDRRREPLEIKASGYAQVFLQDIERYQDKTDLPLVEFGSASGHFLNALAGSGKWRACNLQGIDVCAHSVGLAGTGVPSRTANLEGDEPLDCAVPCHYVVMINTIEHFADPLKVLKRAKSLLDSGGRVFVANVPNSKSVNALAFPEGFISRNFPDGQHLFHFDHETFRRLCEKAGFNVSFEGKRKDIVRGQWELAARWIAQQSGVQLRDNPRFEDMLRRLVERIKPTYAELSESLAETKSEVELVEVWRQKVWNDYRHSDCFDAWLEMR